MINFDQKNISPVINEQMSLFSSESSQDENDNLLDEIIKILHENLADLRCHPLRKEINDYKELDLHKRYYLGRFDDAVTYQEKFKALDKLRVMETGILQYSKVGINNNFVFPYADTSGKFVGYWSDWHRRGDVSSPIISAYGHEKASFFNRQVVARNTEIVIVSNPHEVIAMFKAGIFNAVATMGMRPLNQEHLKDLSDSGIQTVIIAYPNTAEGDSCSNEIAHSLEDINIACRRMLLPMGCSLHQALTMVGDKKAYMDGLYRETAQFNRIKHYRDIDEFSKWQFDFTSFYGVFDFYVSYMFNSDSWQYEKETYAYNFLQFLHREIKSLENYDELTLLKYQQYLRTDFHTNRGKKMSTDGQFARYKAACELQEFLIAHGILSIKGKHAIETRIIH